MIKWFLLEFSIEQSTTSIVAFSINRDFQKFWDEITNLMDYINFMKKQ